MFLILLTYKKPIAEVDRFVKGHREFLEHAYAQGQFLLSGRKEPRSGGVILARAKSRSEVEAILQNDPFYQEQVADFDIIEFTPSMASADLAHLKEI